MRLSRVKLLFVGESFEIQREVGDSFQNNSMMFNLISE